MGGRGEEKQKRMQAAKNALKIAMPARFYWKEIVSEVSTVENLTKSNKK